MEVLREPKPILLSIIKTTSVFIFSRALRQQFNLYESGFLVSKFPLSTRNSPMGIRLSSYETKEQTNDPCAAVRKLIEQFPEKKQGVKTGSKTISGTWICILSCSQDEPGDIEGPITLTRAMINGIHSRHRESEQMVLSLPSGKYILYIQ